MFRHAAHRALAASRSAATAAAAASPRFLLDWRAATAASTAARASAAAAGRWMHVSSPVAALAVTSPGGLPALRAAPFWTDEALSTANHSFDSAEGALRFCDMYIQDLSDYADELRADGVDVNDRVFPHVDISVQPPNATETPLVILGGMGALAGCQALQRALQITGNNRAVRLFQLCNIPDRSVAFTAGKGSPVRQEVVDKLACGMLMLAQGTEEPVDMFVACNTAHFFVPYALEALKAHSEEAYNKLKFQRLMDRVVEHLVARGGSKTLACVTIGTARTGMYSKAFAEAGLELVEPDDKQEEVLMSALYDGVKAMNLETTVARGEEYFGMLRADPERAGSFNTILAGCTEVPELLSVLSDHGSETTKAELETMHIVDPVELVLQ